MIEHKPDSIIQTRIKELKAAIAADDYQVIKAMRLCVDIDELYPLHRATYQKRMALLAEYEKEAADIAAACGEK